MKGVRFIRMPSRPGRPSRQKVARPDAPDAHEMNPVADMANTAYMSQVDDEEMERHLKDFFEENFEALRLEGDRSLAPDVKEAAWQQVLLYWRKLKDLACSVTDTEVRLNLPQQVTPQGRVYGIEGIVDIVRKAGQTTMYDVKTHDAATIRGNLEEYARQLNVYAHIWQNLRGEELDAMAVICTRFPDHVKEALDLGDEARLERALARWNPLINIPFSMEHVEQTIDEFGAVVDAIEGRAFAPKPVEHLRKHRPGERAPFAAMVCVNCDARYSCSSYRTYALGARGATGARFRAYYRDFYAVDVNGVERDEWLSATLDAAPPVDVLEDLLVQEEDE